MKDIRQTVRDRYGKLGAAGTAEGNSCATACCGGAEASPCGEAASGNLGYSDAEISSLPAGADLGLGCGNPQAIAALRSGETVLDLGSGGGIDCFLAARQVGPGGSVIGVDMTPEMIDRARGGARGADASNVEFRLGEIEHLPVADKTADVILSNCVINLSPDKPAVFREAFRVLNSGGRLAISDIVAIAPLPDDVRSDMELHVGCIAGAATIDDLRSMLADAGFTHIRIEVNRISGEIVGKWKPGLGLENYIASATIEAIRP